MDAGRKERANEARKIGRQEKVEARKKGRQEKVDQKERDGQKGKWSNSGYTWYNSWHSPNWHGTASGLEVDRWAAAELVPYLCANQFEIQ